MPARPLAALPPSSWPKNPAYVIDLEPLPFRVRAEVGDETALDSLRALVMFELGHAPVYYVPSDDVRMDLMTPSDLGTHCPYKGDASYWTLTAGGRTVENAVWSYRHPYPEMARLAGLIGVYWDRMDAWRHDDAPVEAPYEITGRINQANNFAKRHPDLAGEWHRERNGGVRPYEFAPDADVAVWWKDAAGGEWRESIRDRVRRDAAG